MALTALARRSLLTAMVHGNSIVLTLRQGKRAAMDWAALSM
jgi:hypothetical protein